MRMKELKSQALLDRCHDSTQAPQPLGGSVYRCRSFGWWWYAIQHLTAMSIRRFGGRRFGVGTVCFKLDGVSESCNTTHGLSKLGELLRSMYH
jgi:hypothetical protein